MKQKLSPSAQSSTKHLDALAILVGRSRGLSWLCLLCRLIVIIINSHRCFTSHNKNCQSKNHSHHRMYQQCYIQRRCWAALGMLLGFCFLRPQRAFKDYILSNLLNILSFSNILQHNFLKSLSSESKLLWDTLKCTLYYTYEEELCVIQQSLL